MQADGRDYTAGLEDGVRGLRVAWSPTLGYAKNVHSEVAAACALAVQQLSELGAHVEAEYKKWGEVVSKAHITLPQ